MKAAKTWCLAGLMAVAGLSSASCGKDEGTDGGGKVITAGSGGGAGVTGRGGSSNPVGAGGAGPTLATALGRACVNDRECVDADAPGLKCITAKDAVLADGAPPKGLCTMPCTMPQAADDVDACAELGPGAMCYPFDGTAQGYCIEGCEAGNLDINAKCHDRPEFACNPALGRPTTTTCLATSDCATGQLCQKGRCSDIFLGCLPNCRGDLDCDAGMYCDQSLFSGVCVAKKQTGKGLGEPCTVVGPNDPAEPDECLGFCQADSATGTQGHCATNCGYQRECSWNSTTKRFEGICFGSTIFSGDTEQRGVGDFGFCMATCNCGAECASSDLSCYVFPNLPLSTDFRGPGLCLTPDPTDPTGLPPEYNQCADSGAGGAGPGAGGAGSGGAPTMDAAGAAGVGGAP